MTARGWGCSPSSDGRLGMEFDHEAEIEDMGQVFQAVVYSITAERWRSTRQR